jgi:hypothetical protein
LHAGRQKQTFARNGAKYCSFLVEQIHPDANVAPMLLVPEKNWQVSTTSKSGRRHSTRLRLGLFLGDQIVPQSASWQARLG